MVGLAAPYRRLVLRVTGTATTARVSTGEVAVDVPGPAPGGSTVAFRGRDGVGLAASWPYRRPCTAPLNPAGWVPGGRGTGVVGQERMPPRCVRLLPSVSMTHPSEFAVPHTLARMLPVLPPAPARLVEVGGGVGALAAALRRRGYDVTVVEPDAESAGMPGA